MASEKKQAASKEEPLEKQLWKAADKLRKNIDAAEYKHVVLGLIFLKYISDSFEEMFTKLQAGEGDYAGADPEDKDEYTAESVFFVPPEARWPYLVSKATQADIGSHIDDAMDAIERENPSLIREALNNCIAHQDYTVASRINVVEREESLSFTNKGSFVPGDVQRVVMESQGGQPALRAAAPRKDRQSRQRWPTLLGSLKFLCWMSPMSQQRLPRTKKHFKSATYTSLCR